MLTIYHSLTELLAGGAGSGCRGPNCGRPRGIKQVYQAPAGYTYTILKPSRRGIAKGSHAWSPRKDQFQGKYKQSFQHKEPMRHSNVYDAAWGKGDKYEGQGKTVIVHRDFDKMRVRVQEIPHDEMQHSATMRVFNFRNFGQAAGFLNKRYGIRQKLPKGA